MHVHVKALAEASKTAEAKKKEETATVKSEKQQQQKLSMRKWSNIITGAIQKPLTKTTSAPPTADLTEGSFKKPASHAQSLKTQMSGSAALKVDGTATKAPLHSILKQQASGMTTPPGERLNISFADNDFTSCSVDNVSLRLDNRSVF